MLSKPGNLITDYIMQRSRGVVGAMPPGQVKAIKSCLKIGLISTINDSLLYLSTGLSSPIKEITLLLLIEEITLLTSF